MGFTPPVNTILQKMYRQSGVDRTGYFFLYSQKKIEASRFSIRERQCGVHKESVLEIMAHGAWNGGTVQDNSLYENKGMFFKGDIPVNDQTIQARIGVKTRMVASGEERIGVRALAALLEENPIDLSRVRLVIGATNVGEDKYDHGPLIKIPYEMIRKACPDAMVFDLYAGCPGFNVSVEVAFALSVSGALKAGDITIIVGAENIHRAKAFKPLDTSNIIFGDDSLATALETTAESETTGRYSCERREQFPYSSDFVTDIARALIRLSDGHRLDGIIIDNHLGQLLHRVPSTAARVQHRLVELLHPEEQSRGTFKRFGEALAFYNTKVKSFAYDIMTLAKGSGLLETIAEAYVRAGKCAVLACVSLSREGVEATLHCGEGFAQTKPSRGIVDTHTRTHGCFADYIHAFVDNGDIFGDMNGKGVFLYATRGAKPHLEDILSRNSLSLNDLDLLIEHQANFAMIPMTLERLLDSGGERRDIRQAVMDYLANRMITNIHTRGNCSVVSMQRLPYDLQRGALEEDMIQGYPVNRNLQNLKSSKIILNDSVGAGMSRSSFLQRL
jgi:3-oxoacyl-[acyl-carrier-protein] synthase III